MTSPHLAPDERRDRLRPFQRHRRAPVSVRDDHDECWQLRAWCSCGTSWEAMAGARKMPRSFGPIKADIAEHRRHRHCVLVSETRYQIDNAQFVAMQVVTYLLSALDQIA